MCSNCSKKKLGGKASGRTTGSKKATTYSSTRTTAKPSARITFGRKK